MSGSAKNPVLFWLRNETKLLEYRTALLPEHAKTLIAAGHRVMVERSPDRCVDDEEYVNVGCELVDTDSWSSAPKDAVILGLKELPESDRPLIRRHIFFAHCYKHQFGWENLLKRFTDGGGHLYDLEFCLNERNRRIAAFGRSAGYVGMALAIQQWCETQADPNSLLRPPPVFKTFKELSQYVNQKLTVQAKGKLPKLLVVGANGRAGKGAVSCALDSGIPEENIVKEVSSNEGPYESYVKNFDIMANCILLTNPIPPFITDDMVDNLPRHLSVITDISCDYTNPHNPLPIYKEGTTFEDPVRRIRPASSKYGPLDVISIDHLPSMVPYESSLEFASDLCPHLVDFDHSDMWKRVHQLFKEKVGEAGLKHPDFD